MGLEVPTQVASLPMQSYHVAQIMCTPDGNDNYPVSVWIIDATPLLAHLSDTHLPFSRSGCASDAAWYSAMEKLVL